MLYLLITSILLLVFVEVLRKLAIRKRKDLYGRHRFIFIYKRTNHTAIVYRRWGHIGWFCGKIRWALVAATLLLATFLAT